MTGNDRFSLKPYVFTPAIFTELFRQTFKAWGYHGFLPKRKNSSAENQGKKLGVNICNYHAKLCVVLETFHFANDCLCNITLPLGPDKSITVDIVTCIFLLQKTCKKVILLWSIWTSHSFNSKAFLNATVGPWEEDNTVHNNPCQSAPLEPLFVGSESRRVHDKIINQARQLP